MDLDLQKSNYGMAVASAQVKHDHLDIRGLTRPFKNSIPRSLTVLNTPVVIIKAVQAETKL